MTPERRRTAQHKLEVTSGVLAGAVGTELGAEKIRDAYAREKPEKLAAIAEKAGPFKHVVTSGRTPAAHIAIGTLAGGITYAAQKAQERSLERQTRNAQRAAKRAKKQNVVLVKGASMGIIAEELAKSERTRRNTENAAAGGAGVAAVGARRSYVAAKTSRAAAATAAEAGAKSSRRAVRGGVLAAHAAATEIPAAYRAGSDAYKGSSRLSRAQKLGAVSDDEALAAGKHKAGLRNAYRAALKTAGTHHAVGEHLADAAKAHRQVAEHTQQAAMHLRTAHTRTGAALGLLAVAAAAHAKRQQPAHIPYY